MYTSLLPASVLLGLLSLSGCGPEPVKLGDEPGGSGDDLLDGDEDGHPASDDCDDANASVHPRADELCNEVDDDCDGAIDEDVTTTWYPDTDGDGYGDTAAPAEACHAPEGY